MIILLLLRNLSSLYWESYLCNYNSILPSLEASSAMPSRLRWIVVPFKCTTRITVLLKISQGGCGDNGGGDFDDWCDGNLNSWPFIIISIILTVGYVLLTKRTHDVVCMFLARQFSFTGRLQLHSCGQIMTRWRNRISINPRMVPWIQSLPVAVS